MTATAVGFEQDLADRLSEAEALIAALLSGQIDAVVDPETRTPVLLTKAQDALRDSERLYRSTFDAAPVGIVHAALNGQWLRVNQRLCTLLGRDCEELQSAAVQRVFESGEAAGEAEAFRDIAAGRLDHYVVDERPYHRADGTIMWARVNMSLHRDAEGKPENVMLVVEDITERRRLEVQAQRYLDTAEIILLGLDMQGRITTVNRYACSIFGRSELELLGRDFIETCIPARLRGETRTRLAGVHGGPDKSIVTNAIISRTGEERMIEWRNTLLRDAGGRVVSTLSSGTDITERDEALKTLRITEERTRFMLKAAGVGIWDMNYTTGALQWSETLEAQYGVAPGTFGGTFEAFAERIHPDDRVAALATVAAAMQSGSDFSVQNRTLWPDGTVRWLTGAGRIHMDEDGRPSRGVGISIDVTDRRILEEQYQQVQKMEAVGRLAGGVAHDFNNLLMVISGYSDILLQGMIVADPRRKDVEQIRKAATAATSLTRQLLAFSRQQVIEPRNVVLEDAVKSATTMLQRLIGEDVEVLTSLKAAGVVIRIDPGQLEQVMMNLAINARDAMPTGGKLTIETAIVDLTKEDSNAHWPVVAGRFAMLAVSDTGIGMDAQTRAKIFEPFFTTKDQGKGTGLGLATVYGIVKQSDGFIWVYSEPGQGATFKVYFPIAVDASAPEPPAGPESSAPRGVETIVVVEDSDGVRDIARRVLERQGYHVITADGSAAALEIAKTFTGRIHLLLTDIVMPEMSGRVLAETFLEHHPRAKLLYMSGYTDDAVVRHGVLKADTPYLQKPFSPHALAGRVRAVLDSR